jgi:hypothetical protein
MPWAHTWTCVGSSIRWHDATGVNVTDPLVVSLLLLPTTSQGPNYGAVEPACAGLCGMLEGTFMPPGTLNELLPL